MADEFFKLQESGGVYRHRTVPPIANALSAEANPTISVTDAEVRRYTTALTANRTITCSQAGAWKGARFRIVRADTAAFTLEVKNHDAATIKTIPNGTAAFVDVEYDGTNWVLTGYGAL